MFILPIEYRCVVYNYYSTGISYIAIDGIVEFTKYFQLNYYHNGNYSY